MHNPCLVLTAAMLVLVPMAAQGDTIDGGVIQVRLPGEDATLLYVEARGGFTVRLQTDNSSIEARRMYLGDGKVAVELVADALKGPLFQGLELDQGYVFKKDATIKVLPGFKKAVDLNPGSVYVILPGVTFEVPKPKTVTIEDLLR